MDLPYQELATLVGRILAKRWLNRSAQQSKSPIADSKHEADDIVESMRNARNDADAATTQNGMS